jgi:hypothetical protein
MLETSLRVVRNMKRGVRNILKDQTEVGSFFFSLTLSLPPSSLPPPFSPYPPIPPPPLSHRCVGCAGDQQQSLFLHGAEAERREQREKNRDLRVGNKEQREESRGENKQSEERRLPVWLWR